MIVLYMLPHIYVCFVFALLAGRAGVQSGASETEALHEAYRQIAVRGSELGLQQAAGSEPVSPPPLVRDTLQPHCSGESGQNHSHGAAAPRAFWIYAAQTD